MDHSPPRGRTRRWALPALVACGALAAGAAPALAANLTLTPSPVPFANTVAGSSSDQQVLVRNNTAGGVTLRATAALDLQGNAAHQAQYAILGTGSCVNGLALAANATCTVDVRFAPSATGNWNNARLRVRLAGGDVNEVDLNGAGVQPALTALNDPLDFGSENVDAASPNENVRIRNTGTSDLHVSGVTLGGTDPGDFDITNIGCTTVVPGDACNVRVRFRPTATGARSATVIFASDAPGSPHSATVTGFGTRPSFAAAPAAFGNRNVGEAGPDQDVTVTNGGDGPLAISGVTIVGTNPGDFGIVSNGCAAPVAPNGDCVVRVSFVAAATGARAARLRFVDDAPGSPHQVDLTGFGTQPNFAAADVAFGNRNVGETGPNQDATIRNTGNGPMSVSGLSLVGTNPGDFGIVSNGCTAPIAAGASCIVRLSFTPTASGARSARLRVVDTAPGSPHQVNLTGFGTRPVFAVSPTSLAFPDTVLGESSAAKSVTVRNTGNGPLTMSRSLVGPDANDFFVSATSCGGLLAPAASCTVSVRFRPNEVGGHSASLRFAHNAAGSPTSVALSGTGCNISIKAGLLGLIKIRVCL